MGEIRKYTSENLMRDMGLQVGDRVKNLFNGHIFIITDNFKLASTEDKRVRYDINWLIDKNIEILPRPKRVGELDCFVEIKCNNCPLRMISGCTNSEGIPLYDILKEIQIDSTKNNMFDQEIYDLLKARLDKEVE